MAIKKHIPNAITCCNLLCGCLAIVQCFEGNLVTAAYLVGLAAIFDFFDGFAARLLRVSSPIGKDLDSLADMVTFGVVPGIVMYRLIEVATANYYEYNRGDDLLFLYPYIKYVAFLIPIFSAIRLAKFNHDTRQTSSFIGLPTPANAIFICSIPLILEYSKIHVILNIYILIVIAIVFSLLLIAEIPLFALKFRNFSWVGNRTKYTFLALSLVLLFTLQFVGIPLVIILYILMSVITNVYLKRKSI